MTSRWLFLLALVCGAAMCGAAYSADHAAALQPSNRASASRGAGHNSLAKPPAFKAQLPKPHTSEKRAAPTGSRHDLARRAPGGAVQADGLSGRSTTHATQASPSQPARLHQPDANRSARGAVERAQSGTVGSALPVQARSALTYSAPPVQNLRHRDANPAVVGAFANVKPGNTASISGTSMSRRP